MEEDMAVRRVQGRTNFGAEGVGFDITVEEVGPPEMTTAAMRYRGLADH